MVRTMAVMTSGGDAPGMNAGVRAVVRRALDGGMDVYGVFSGYEGLVAGGDAIRPLGWNDVGGILPRGGTFLGTARSERFRTVEGRRQAVKNLCERGIQALVVIGGDGSLMGARVLAEEWQMHCAELGQEAPAEGRAGMPERLHVVGLPGSIDNDLYGTDMSIGADTALNHIVHAIDDLTSTAASHQRTFIVETMGRHCGYLALMGALGGGASWVLVPEEELDLRWHEKMSRAIERARAIGRPHQMVVVAEGARHPDGLPIRTEELKRILAERLGIDVRVTVLGHVQRGGPPSAFDRILATRLGVAAVELLMGAGPEPLCHMVGLQKNRVTTTSLSEVVEKSRAVGRHIDRGNYQEAQRLRGEGFVRTLDLVKTLTRIEPAASRQEEGCVAILTGGADAPGMNTAVSIAARCLLNDGYAVLGVRDAFRGLIAADFQPLEWNQVTGWVNRPSSELGTARHELSGSDLERIARNIQAHHIRGLIAVGGLGAYLNAKRLMEGASSHPALALPLVLIPATIDNNLPCTEFTIGCDTALNNIVQALDKIRHTAGANRRAFVVEVMGRQSGFLALAGALASGAEKAYLPERGISLAELNTDVEALRESFRCGKRMVIYLRNENASRHYTTDFIARLLEEESRGLYQVRTAILGHLQRGGSPTAFDRILACRMGSAAAREMGRLLEEGARDGVALGLRGRGVEAIPLGEALEALDLQAGRPRRQWFLELDSAAQILARSAPSCLVQGEGES
ncbi:6-phosphofructokinase 1 [Desulfacinum hydrothermale DSM 13146]|uniref:6-phosphofructokinase n=1 Tax=Desulfacinum hydrothermale DSM 13146 TaxID=1121390 RepID=A0A1W1X0T8_9BACT|nr:6-phosphofructokinase [Desulfacinum hydrothermale]SMC17338.1 6-phosphofructokinase 1 [Desulfacinum hydrothermale DSM 13146]